MYADAVVITTSLRSVRGSGHTSILVQDNLGKWHYFFWGDFFAYLKEVPAEAIENLETFNSWLSDAVKSMPTSHSRYAFGTRIKGDFSKSYLYYKDLVGN